MKRRGFFKSLLGIGAAAALPPVKQLEAAPIPLQERTFHAGETITFEFAGMGDYMPNRFVVPQCFTAMGTFGPFPSTNTVTFDYASPEAK